MVLFQRGRGSAALAPTDPMVSHPLAPPVQCWGAGCLGSLLASAHTRAYVPSGSTLKRGDGGVRGGVAFGREVEVAGGYGESLAQFRRRLDKAENHMNSNEAGAEDDCESLSRLCACMRQCFAMIVTAGGGRIPKCALSSTMRGRCPALAADLVFWATLEFACMVANCLAN